MERKIRRKLQDSIFTSLFREKKYLQQLVLTLHPEMDDITENDIKTTTLDCVLANGIYNDLGFTVKDKVIILVESQSTWSLNILPRIFFYLAETYRRLLKDKNLYGTKLVRMPESELYVIFTGNKKDVPSEISLSHDFFGKESTFVDIKAKVLKETASDNIVNQYIICTRILKEQIALHGKNPDAVLEAIKICKNKNVLKEYLTKREVEVMDRMSFLFDQETVTKNYGEDCREEGREEGITEGRAEGYKVAKAESDAQIAKMASRISELERQLSK